MILSLITGAVFLFALASLILNGLAVWRGWRFANKPPFSPLSSSNLPSISLVVPVCGIEAGGIQHFQRFCELDWPVYQLIFTILDPKDPAIPLLKQIVPPSHVDLTILSGGEAIGANLKVRNLQNAQSVVKHDWMVVCDADVEPDTLLLRGLMSPFDSFNRDGKVGLTHSLYRIRSGTSHASDWESVWINCDFWVQGLLGDWMKGTDFAFGAAMAFRRDTLESIGGWPAFRDHLADDYELGHRIAARNKRILFNPRFVTLSVTPQSWSQTWQHLLRWSRTIRVCQPWGYAGSLVLNMTFAALLLLAADPNCFYTPCLSLILCRILFANQCRNWILGTRGIWSRSWMILFKDLAQILLWILAFRSGPVRWRGVRYLLKSDGTLHLLDSDAKIKDLKRLEKIG